jgi:hypothetical protein
MSGGSSAALAGKDMSSQHDEDNVMMEGLHEIRVRRRCVWIVFAAYIPVCLLAVRLFGDKAGGYAAGLCMLVFAVAGARVHFSRCPRCGNLFHSTGFWHNIWVRKCMHCGLRLDTYEP